MKTYLTTSIKVSVMHRLIAIVALVLSSTASTTADNVTLIRCGTQAPPPTLLDMARTLENSTSKIAATEPDRALEINLYMHMVYSEENEGAVTDQMVEDQIDVLNEFYSPHGITFRYISSTATTDNDWATGDYDLEMKAALRQGTYADLNLYYLSDLTVAGLLGQCNFPADIIADPSVLTHDGCVIATGTVPGGHLSPYNEGGTTTHEVGHWFGLLHTFEGASCEGDGDYVSDTPTQQNYTRGCPESQDTCPEEEGSDAIHNPMDYSNDAW